MKKTPEQRVDEPKKKIAELEGRVPAQPNELTPNELECIARHISHYTEVVMKGRENVPDACEECINKWCKQPGSLEGKIVDILDPWPTLFKLSDMTSVPIKVGSGPARKPDTGHAHP
jgi:hypothetical protein